MSAGDLVAMVKDSDTRYLLAMFVDLRGKQCAKLVPASAVELLATEGVGFAGFAVGAIGQQPSDPDLMAMPDPASFAPIPFVRPGLAVVHCDPYVNGKPWPYAPRVILQTALAKAAANGLAAYVGSEIEYFLLSRNESGGLQPADLRDAAAQPCYDARGVTRMLDHLTAVSEAMNSLGWSNYANDHEDANGQFEQNFEYTEALTTADRVITARYLISVLAEQRQMTATFMAKPFTNRTGTGLHLHLSLRRTGNPGEELIFPSPDDPRGLGLSALAYAFIAGILDHASALQAVIAPTVNSYKRTGAATPASGATWAPRVPSYGGNDRSHFIRVPDEQRIELRGPDGSANPYLAMTAAITAGLDGIDRRLDPGQPGDQFRDPLPPTLLHAIEALTADAVISGALDAAGAGVTEYFADLKRQEFWDWHHQVSDWEIDRYLQAF